MKYSSLCASINYLTQLVLPSPRAFLQLGCVPTLATHLESPTPAPPDSPTPALANSPTPTPNPTPALANSPTPTPTC